jgi:SAM-dependent methyltransferase
LGDGPNQQDRNPSYPEVWRASFGVSSGDNPSMSPIKSQLPPYELFRAACESGLSVVRPLKETARDRDEFGWNFGSAWPPSYEAYGRMRALATLQKAEQLRPKRILEIAAGDASLSACLAARGAMACANDLRIDQLTAAVEMFETGEQITVLAGNCFELDPEQTGRFDLVTACEVIEHVAHPVDLLRQLKRFLEPGGHILLTTPNGAYFHNCLPTYGEIEDMSALESRQFKPDADGHLFLLTPLELNELAAQAGLQVEAIDLSATPLITGHLKLSRMRGQRMARLCYWFEEICQRMPWRVRSRLCFSLSAVLTVDSPSHR